MVHACRSDIDHIFESDNAVNQFNIIMHLNTEPCKGYLLLKVNITLSCRPSCTSSRDVTFCKQIKNIDWSKESIREQYLKNIKRYTTDTNSSNVVNITESRSAQQCECVSELNSGIITTIVRHVLIPQGNATFNHKYKNQNQSLCHGALTPHRLLRTGSHCGMISGLRVIIHLIPMCKTMYVINLQNKILQACRLAFNKRVRSFFHRLNFLYTISYVTVKRFGTPPERRN